MKKQIPISQFLIAVCLAALSTSAGANVTTSPSSVDFGTVAVGTTSSTVSVILTNNGPNRVNVNSVSIPSGFSYTGPASFALASSASFTVGVSFIPTAAQSYSGSLTLNASGGTQISVGLSGVGTSGAQPAYNVYANFEAGSDGQKLSTSTLTAGTPCNAAPGGRWAIAGNAARQMSVSTASQNSLLGSITACGKTFAPPDGSRGITYDLHDGGSTGAAEFDWSASSSNASAGIWVKIGIPTADTDYHSMFCISDGTGDFVSMMIHSGQIYIEVGANPNGAPDVGSFFNYTPNVWYWVTEQFQARVNGMSMHSLNVYDAAGNLLSAQKKYTASYGTVKPYFIRIGKIGDTGTPSALIYYDNFIADTTGATFPILPLTP